MEATGVNRLICQSTAGVGDSRDLMPFLMKYLIVPLILRRAWADHEIQENYIKESQLKWTIVRPTALTNGGHTGSYQHGFKADNKKGEEDNRPNWSKDGQYIAFNRVKPDGSRIYIMTLK